MDGRVLFWIERKIKVAWEMRLVDDTSDMLQTNIFLEQSEDFTEDYILTLQCLQHRLKSMSWWILYETWLADNGEQSSCQLRHSPAGLPHAPWCLERTFLQTLAYAQMLGKS